VSDEEIHKLKPTVWLKAIDGMLVDMLTGDVMGPSCLEGFGYRYTIPPPSPNTTEDRPNA
jgi:hypothetical protein